MQKIARPSPSGDPKTPKSTASKNQMSKPTLASGWREAQPKKNQGILFASGGNDCYSTSNSSNPNPHTNPIDSPTEHPSPGHSHYPKGDGPEVAASGSRGVHEFQHAPWRDRQTLQGRRPHATRSPHWRSPPAHLQSPAQCGEVEGRH